ncbi:hypothetical protein BDR26DRAFT_852507 [Obelidium mucronatum]|nr:hypothetical protein BDR26DRAFT_852507 [Obelidium mucronatum]
MGLCSDYAQYILYADARLNPEFDEETYKTKLLLCPKTIHLHFEAVRKVWAPNIEQISKDDVTAFLRTSKYLCKTKITCTAIEKYLAANNLLLSQRNNDDDDDDDEEHIRVQQKNSDLEYAHLPGQQLVYMSHSSIDVLEDSQQVLGAKRFAEIKQDFNQFLHVQGKSGRKHTREMYNCWKEHNDWPKLTIIGNQNKTKYETDLPTIGPMPDNIQVFTHLNVEELRSIQASIGIHVCPSSQEGYGHYINEARSLGALVLTTDYPPMNEFVKDAVSGILIGHDPPAAEEYQLLTPQFISPVHVEPKHICDAVARVLKDFDVSKRREMGRKAREAFEYDTYLMQTNMVQLKEEAYTHLNGR